MLTHPLKTNVREIHGRGGLQTTATEQEALTAMNTTPQLPSPPVVPSLVPGMVHTGGYSSKNRISPKYINNTYTTLEKRAPALFAIPVWYTALYRCPPGGAAAAEQGKSAPIACFRNAE